MTIPQTRRSHPLRVKRPGAAPLFHAKALEAPSILLERPRSCAEARGGCCLAAPRTTSKARLALNVGAAAIPRIGLLQTKNNSVLILVDSEVRRVYHKLSYLQLTCCGERIDREERHELVYKR